MEKVKASQQAVANTPSPLSLRSASIAQRTNPFLRFQQSIGNQAVLGLLKIDLSNHPNVKDSDTYEREDARATQTLALGGAPPPALRAQTCVQRHPADTHDSRTRTDLSTPIREVLNSPGQPLENNVLSTMQDRFGRDFGHVRIHTDERAAQAAKSVDALAYTVGNHVVFDRGQYQPHSGLGSRLLAHELTHVVQQSQGSGPASGEAHEREADSAMAPLPGGGSHAEVKQAARPSIARMSVAEARSKLWGLVPESVKPYVRPVAQAAAARMDAVIPPDTQLPKPVEAIVQLPVEAKKAVTAVAKPSSKTPGPGQPPPSKPPSALQVIKEQALGKVRDKVMGELGSAKGVVLEATNIVDTVVWVSYAEHSVVKSAVTATLGKGPAADAILKAHDFTTGYYGVEQAATQFGLFETDPITGEKGAPAISGAVSKAIDEQADKLETAFGVPKEDPLVFTEYELGELGGAIGTQVALAFVGVEEVQLVLKGLGLVGGIKGIVDAIQQNPSGWQKDPKFWAGVLNAVLSVVGLKSARAGRKIINIVIASGGALVAVPAIWQLYNDYTKLPESPERDKTMKRDLENIIKILANVVAQIARHGAAPKPAAPTEAVPGGKVPVVPELEGQIPAQKPAPQIAEVEPQPLTTKTAPDIPPTISGAPEVTEPSVPRPPAPPEPKLPVPERAPQQVEPKPTPKVPKPAPRPERVSEPETKVVTPEPETRTTAVEPTPEPEPKVPKPEPKTPPLEPEPKPKAVQPEPKAPEQEPKAPPPEREAAQAEPKTKAAEPEPEAKPTTQPKPKVAPAEAEPEQRAATETEPESKPKTTEPEKQPAEKESGPQAPPAPATEEQIQRLTEENQRLSAETEAAKPKLKQAKARLDTAQKEFEKLDRAVDDVKNITKEAAKRNPLLELQYEAAEKLRARFKTAAKEFRKAKDNYEQLESQQAARYEQFRKNRSDIETLSRPELQLEPTARGRANELRVLREEGLLGIKRQFTVRDPKTGEYATTIPDGMRPDGRTVDVKDVAELSETQQLRLQRAVSEARGLKAEIITGTRTKVPEEMQKNYIITRRPDLGPRTKP